MAGLFTGQMLDSMEISPVQWLAIWRGYGCIVAVGLFGEAAAELVSSEGCGEIVCSLVLTGNRVEGPGVGSRKLGFRTMAAIAFTRLILVPPVGLCIVTLVDKLGFIPKGDKMFKFVLLLQHSTPTSVLSGITLLSSRFACRSKHYDHFPMTCAVANLQGCGKEAAAVLFWIHIFSVISMAGWIILYLAILF
ncbi:hypothetical protein IEQ34_012611 [Dendrobium chrysotoxum]|uniref:Uncharacterized protein n=1 Tax=Dendrobium chrysotoxum TaxID=161865 RepID=A0AAV7GMC7_DENCH|nr:hypothetical protein IEQ34_012611 [Dendrobium chrysotoxum]